MARVRLSRLKDGQAGKVVDIQGCVGFLTLMEQQGIIIGETVQKVKTVKQAKRTTIYVRIIGTRHEIIISFQEAENIIVKTQEPIRPPVHDDNFAYT